VDAWRCSPQVKIKSDTNIGNDGLTTKQSKFIGSSRGWVIDVHSLTTGEATKSVISSPRGYQRPRQM
jgi:hypothetical protein